MMGLRCCTWAFPSWAEQGLLFIVVTRLLTAAASLVAELGLQARGLQESQRVGPAVAHGFSYCAARGIVGSSWTRA